MLSTKKFQLNFKIQPKTVMILKSHSNTPNFEIAFFFGEFISETYLK